MRKDLSSLKVGDAVLYRYMGGRFQKKIVEGITPTGRIKVAGETFRPNGDQIGGSTWRKSYIYPFDQTILDKQEARDIQNAMRQDCERANWRNMDDALVAQIHALLPKEKPVV